MAADHSPSTMRLALLSPIHGQSIDHITRQLENYRVFLAPFELRHYFHVSLESHPNLQSELTAFAEREGHSIAFTKGRRPTWRTCTCYALCELIKTVLADHHIHDKVLIHTDTDLLLSKKAKSQLQKHRIGCGYQAVKLDNPSNWKWKDKAQSDPHLQRFVREIFDNDPSNLRRGRVCGAHMPWPSFKILGILYNEYFNNNYFTRTSTHHWPVTEIAIPSILHFLEGQETNFQPPLIKAPQERKITRKSIDKLLKKREHFGLKKLARNTNSKAFQYAMSLQNQAAQQI